MRKRVTGRPVSAVFLVGVVLASLGDGQAAEKRGLLPGSQAPNFFVNTYNPETCGSKRVFLDRLVGERASEKRKLLLLSFFNIDCKPCRKELPFLQRLFDHYRSDGLAVVVVNCDYKREKIDEAIRYVRQAGFTFPVLKDRFGALQRRYAVAEFPTMYIVDSAGLIVDLRVGYNEEKMPFPLADVQRRLGVKVEALTEPSALPPASADAK